MRKYRKHQCPSCQRLNACKTWEDQHCLTAMFSQSWGGCVPVYFFGKTNSDCREYIQNEPDTEDHKWIKSDGKLYSYYCEKCGIIKTKEGKNKPCQGVVKVTMRGMRGTYTQEKH